MRKNHGFTLLEVIISAMLFAVVLLGAVMASVTSTRVIRGTIYFQQASMLAESMVIYLASHDDNPAGYLRLWLDDIHHQLPAASGAVNTVSRQISVSWGGAKSPCQKIHSGVSGCVLISI